MTKRGKPKLIPLKELRALCKEAGVEINTTPYGFCVYRDGEHILIVYGEGNDPRKDVKAFCLGLIAMRKAGEI